MTSMSITNLKPYTFKVVHRRTLLDNSIIQILYEDQVVRTVSYMREADVENIVKLLNAAYQLGYSDGTVQGYNNDLPVLHHEVPGL